MSPSLQTMGFFMSDINFCNTKEQLNHLGEVVTGKVDGSPTGADIDTSTLPYTGQVRKTLPALEGEYEQSITDKEAEADAAIDSYRLLNKGQYASGITLESKFEFITYNGESYFATNPPYTTTATAPDADGNLLVGGYVNESLATQIAETVLEENISTYTDIVYKASGGNSAVENMVVGGSNIGDILSTGRTIWERVIKSEPSVIGDFKPVNNASVIDFGAYLPSKGLAGALEEIYALGMVAEIPSVSWANRFTLERKIDVGENDPFKIVGLGKRLAGILGNTEDEMYSYIQILAGGGFSGGVGPNDRRSINCDLVTFVGPNASPTTWRTALKQETVFNGTFSMKLTSNAFIALEYGENNDRGYFNEYRYNLFGNCTYPLMLDDTNSTTWVGNFIVACVHGIVGAPVSESCYLEDNKFNITNETISCINIGGGVEFGGSTYLENFATIENPKGLVPIVYRPTSGDRWAKIGNIYSAVGGSAPMVNIVLLTTPSVAIRTRIEINNIYKSGNTSGKAIQFGASNFDDSGLDPRLVRNGNGALQLVDLDLASTNLLPSDVGNFYISDKPITKGLIQNGAAGRLELQAGNVIDKGAQFQTYSDRFNAFRAGEFVLKLNLVLSSSAGGTLRVRPTVSGSVIETVLQDVAASGNQTISYELPANFTEGQTIYFDTAVTAGDVTIESGSYSFEFIDEGLKSDPF